VKRRRFLAGLEGVSVAALASALGLPLGGCIGFHYVNSTREGNRVLVGRREFGGGGQGGGGAARFALVDVPGLDLPIYLYHHDDDVFTAVSTRCMHRGCPVEPVAGHLVCPCHGSEYDNDGRVLKGPTRLPLERFPVRVEGDVVLIELPTAPGKGA
jgi:cytochrome b6-f complex iron-sulfur subunit